MLSVKIIAETELNNELYALPEKLKYRLLAKDAGWRIANFCVVEFVQSDNAYTLCSQLNQLNISKRFTTEQIHVLILSKPTQTERTIRWFLNTFQLNDLLVKISEKGQNRVLITEVIQPLLSGMSSYQHEQSVIEVAYGQMIAKGNVETSYYRFYKDAMIQRQEFLQKYSNIIENGKIITREINQIPCLEDYQLHEIIKNTRNFIYEMNKPFTIEWFISRENLVYFLDATEEISFTFVDTIKNKALQSSIFIEKAQSDKIQNPNLIKNSEIIQGKIYANNPILISPGIATAKICKINIKSIESIQNSLNLHFQDLHQNPSVIDNINEKYIYFCDSPKLEYEELLKSAAGFIFKFGSCLSHLANLIRSQRIPACIDGFLYQQFDSSVEPLIFHCNDLDKRSSKMHLESIDSSYYNQKLFTVPIKFPVLSDQSSFLNTAIGGKALNLNLLKSYKVLIPKAVFLTIYLCNRNFTDNRFNLQSQIYLTKKNRTKYITFEKNLHLIFPKFGKNAKYQLICRSSSTLEDETQISAAGIFESIPFIKTIEQMQTALTHVLNFSSSSRVKDYCEFNKIDIKNIQMGIIIQKFIQPQFSGVLFTRFRLQNNSYQNNQIVIELTYKNFDGVTSGKDEPLRICIDKKSSYKKKSLSKEMTFITKEWPSFIFTRFPFNRLRKFIMQCIKIDDDLNTPLDFEFVIDNNNKIWFIQCRPALNI